MGGPQRTIILKLTISRRSKCQSYTNITDSKLITICVNVSVHNKVLLIDMFSVYIPNKSPMSYPVIEIHSPLKQEDELPINLRGTIISLPPTFQFTSPTNQLQKMDRQPREYLHRPQSRKILRYFFCLCSCFYNCFILFVYVFIIHFLINVFMFL